MTEEITERDLKMAEEIGGIKAMINSMSQKLDSHAATISMNVNSMKQDKERDHDAIWKKVDIHADKIEAHNGLIRWIIGVGTTAWAALGLWIGLRHN